MTSSQAHRDNQVFFWAHLLLLGIVLLGFGRSFYLRPVFTESSLSAPLVLHGALLTCWFVLTVAQAWSALSGRSTTHRQVAWLAVPLVAGVVASGAWVNTALALQIKSAEDPENMFIWGNYMSLLSFVVLVALAVVQRRRPAIHRRLMVFASIAIIGPAFARFAFWPAFGKLGLVFAPAFAVGGMLLMSIAALVYDTLKMRRPMAVTWGGVAAIVLPLVLGTGVALSGVGFALLPHG